MGRYSVKRYKTKRRTRDLDLIYNDISDINTIRKLKNQPLDENKPGLGQYYCVECAKYYENQHALDCHIKTKVHKRRVKELKQRPYSNLESEAATGTNMHKFMESVEKFKTMENYKLQNKQEFDDAKLQKKDDLDALITGIPSEPQDAGSVNEVAPVKEVEMTD